MKPIKYRVILYLLVDTGIRRGELCGIKWSCVDFQTNEILIENNIQWSRETALYNDTPNMDKIRTLSISSDIMDILKEYKKEEDELKTGRSADGEEYNLMG